MNTMAREIVQVFIRCRSAYSLSLVCNSGRQLVKRTSCTFSRRKFYSSSVSVDYDQLVEVSESAKEDAQCISIKMNFATPNEERNVVKEVSRVFKGKKYKYDHWDGAIQGFRETEKGHWAEESQPLVERLQGWTRNAGKDLEVLGEVHVLDLAEDGEIKPHIDSVKFCGEVIAGVSLLSSSVMNLRHETDPDKWINIFLPKLSLYCLTDVVRFKYTHAIPKGDESSFMGRKIVRERRLSLICRTVPSGQH